MTSMQRFGTYNQVLPKEGPKCFSFILDFTVLTTQEIDFTQPITEGFVSFVSGFYIDNRLNATEINIKTDQTNQRLGIPAGKQAYMPLLIAGSPKFIITTVVANNLLIPFFPVNFPVTPLVW